MPMSFKTVATEQVKLLVMVFLLGSFFLMLQPSKPSSCERDFHLRVFLTHHYLVLTVYITGLLLLWVQMDLSEAEVDSIAAAAHAAAGGARAKREAAAAVVEGVGAIAVKWRRVSTRATLLLAVVLSFVASFLAVVTFEDGFWFWTGCDAGHAGYRVGSPSGVVLTVTMALVHGSAAWVAVCGN